MHRFTAPPKPPRFDLTVAQQRKLVEDRFKAGELVFVAPKKKKKGAKPAGKKKAKEVDPFANLWSDFKPLFAEAQKNKCAFCEGDAAVQQFGDVEHFRPKGAIHQLKNEGQEQPHSPKVKGRTGPRVGATGYWWMAYDWENYILACQICNRQWKANFFPIREEPRANDAPLFGVVETPLLLHPFSGEEPREHLEYNEFGEIKAVPGSDFGAATIRTLGLNRAQLVDQRLDIAAAVIDAIEENRQKDLTDRERARILKELYRLGKSRAPFCGMVRTLIHRNAAPELTWEQIETTFEPIPLPPP